ncbi:MAG TPA: RNA polymerase sigma factor [Spirochaetota bacterium]|nr:RNA polymerase sigma factor [Spirochaetota bacterium]HQO02738.1 RNA polymerase sigma factor [Spirochaetota bacterium]HQP49957.1 RNA polymerase sigma factor [Spirochaetota bacterium]
MMIQGSVFREISDSGEGDSELIRQSLEGDRGALEKLILRHQGWIYNIAFKMVMDHDDACDITQEILIKAVTSLSSYDPHKGAFRTWLYRITANHVLTMKKKKFELRIHDIETYVSLIEKLPDDRYYSRPDRNILEEEIKNGCMMGMLMCLSRKERIVFILGGIFGITDAEGSEILEISRENFRKILSRGRKKIYSHINGFCGHVDPRNPCRCSHKISSFLTYGMADPGNLRYHRPSDPAVRDVISDKYENFVDLYYYPFFEHYRQQPFCSPPDMTQWLRDILQHEQFKEIFNL